jgi:DNA mismatch repair protein MutS2
LYGLNDVRGELREASVAGASLDPESLLHVAETASAASQVKAYLSARKQNFPLLFELSRSIADLKDVAKHIEAAISSDGSIKDDASSELRHIRQTHKQETRGLESKLQGILTQWSGRGYLQDSMIAYREGRLVLPVKDTMRGRVQGVIVDQSSTGSTVFVEPVETLEASNHLRQLELEEKREIHRILLDLTSRVHARLDDFRASLEALTELDEFYGRARLAMRWDATDVVLKERGSLRILRGRHPLLIERLKSEVIPLSFEMAEPLKTIVISGPNAGGKTVVLKTVGLFCVMAAAGLFVPVAPGSELTFFTGIHADIGDAQSIESDLSTFTAHIMRLKRIIEDPSKPKLVLIDEIGSSTDPALGAALAEVVLLELVRQQAITLVTTHHGTLKAFAQETPGIENGSMAFDEATLKPTYAFRAGMPGSSYALEIAARVGFPAHLLDQARGFLGKGMLGLEELVSDLSRKIEDYEKLRRESDLKLTEYHALQKLYAERTAQLKKVQAETKQKAVAEAEAMIAQTGRDMEAAIRTIRKENASREAIKSAKEKITEASQEIEKTRRAVEKTLEPAKPDRLRLDRVNVGDRVEIEDIEGIATIVAIQKGGKRVEVEIGGARIAVDSKRLYAPPAEKKPERDSRVALNFTLETKYVTDQLDLRGKYGDEAIPEVDSYLAAASESNLKQVTLIHGKGTGALRVKVHQFLNTHPLVKSYHDGGRNQDDFGSTVVEMK